MITRQQFPSTSSAGSERRRRIVIAQDQHDGPESEPPKSGAVLSERFQGSCVAGANSVFRVDCISRYDKIAEFIGSFSDGFA